MAGDWLTFAQTPTMSDTPVGIMVAALAMVGTVVTVMHRLLTGQTARADNAFTAYLTAVTAERDTNRETAERAEARALNAERKVEECARQVASQQRTLYRMSLRMAAMTAAMRSAGLPIPPDLVEQ